MEEMQKYRMNEHFRHLVATTVVSQPLLDFFIEKGILVYFDKLIIDAKKTTPGKVAEFYRLLQMKQNAFPVLLDALCNSGQGYPLTILRRGVIPPQLIGILLPAVRVPGERRRQEEQRQNHRQVQNQQGDGRGDCQGQGRQGQPSIQIQDQEEAMEQEPALVYGGQEAEGQGHEGGVQVAGSVQAQGAGSGFASRVLAAAGVDEAAPQAGADDEVDGSLESTDEGHPLMNQKVLANLFQYFLQQSTRGMGDEAVAAKHAQLKRLRLVCKKWRDELTPLYRELVPMVFGDFPDLQVSPAHFRQQVSASISKLKRFLSCMRMSRMIPIQTYELHADLFVQGAETVMRDFLQICGPEAKCICLLVEDSLTENYDLATLPGLNLKKLKVLDITLGDSKMEAIPVETHGLAGLIALLLNGAEKLDVFRFEFDRPPRQKLNGRHQSLLRQIENVIRVGLPRSVTDLTLLMPLQEMRFFQTLIERGITLKDFDYTSHPLMGGELTRRFLTTQAPTLKVLQLGRVKCKILEIPRLPNLEHLELRDTARIREFNFARIFPKVNVLDLSSWQNDEESSILSLLSFASSTAPAVRLIYLPNWVNLAFPRIRMEARVSRCFPNAHIIWHNNN